MDLFSEFKIDGKALYLVCDNGSNMVKVSCKIK